jgi:CubicO group peptidase (beta-lactamase class C family)
MRITPAVRGVLSCLLLSCLAAAQVRPDPNAAPRKPIDQTELIAQLTKALDQAVAGDNFSGAVLLAKDGKPVFEKAYGLASKDYDAANRLDTKFNLGSIDKIFTRVAIGQLIQQGKISSVDDKLIKYLPDYPNKDAAQKVTLRQMLNMQSGIGDFFGPKFSAAAKDEFRSNADFLPLFAAEPLQFEPGTQRKYSNGGYIVLGAIIEKLSGQTYYDYVRENICKPLGMNDTDFYATDEVIANRATGYTKRGLVETAYRRKNIYTLPERGSAAGGGYSTTHDLLKFANAAFEGKVLVPDFAEDAKPSPGLPFQAIRRVAIAGGSPGVNALMESALPGGYTLIVLANYDPPAAESVADELHGFMGLKME